MQSEKKLPSANVNTDVRMGNPLKKQHLKKSSPYSSATSFMSPISQSLLYFQSLTAVPMKFICSDQD